MTVTPKTIAGVALIAGLQEQGFIEGGGFRANREQALATLRAAEIAVIGDRHDWVREASALLGFQGETGDGTRHVGMQSGEELTIAGLLYLEADRLEVALA